jgi:hypothetical protein
VVLVVAVAAVAVALKAKPSTQSLHFVTA